MYNPLSWQVDALNRHWLIPTDVIRSLFVRDPFTFFTMYAHYTDWFGCALVIVAVDREDYMLSFQARKHRGIQTYTVCPQKSTDKVGWLQTRKLIANRWHHNHTESPTTLNRVGDVV